MLSREASRETHDSHTFLLLRTRARRQVRKYTKGENYNWHLFEAVTRLGNTVAISTAKSVNPPRPGINFWAVVPNLDFLPFSPFSPPSLTERPSITRRNDQTSREETTKQPAQKRPRWKYVYLSLSLSLLLTPLSCSLFKSLSSPANYCHSCFHLESRFHMPLPQCRPPRSPNVLYTRVAFFLHVVCASRLASFPVLFTLPSATPSSPRVSWSLLPGDTPPGLSQTPLASQITRIFAIDLAD